MSAAQTDRVLAMLRRHPVTIEHTDCQPAADGGDKITRLAARIGDLKKRGHVIDSRRVKLGGASVAEYVLTTDAEATPKPVGIAQAMQALEDDTDDGAEWWEAAAA